MSRKILALILTGSLLAFAVGGASWLDRELGVSF